MRIPDVDYPRANNGMVEGYIGDLKGIVKSNNAALGKFGTIKVGRYIEKKYELIQLQIKEIDVGYSQTKFQRNKNTRKASSQMVYDDLSLTTENWGGKGKMKKKKEKLFFSSSQQ